jgi:intracellular sulfur oxidation DsrE/DsrF family protein
MKHRFASLHALGCGLLLAALPLQAATPRSGTDTKAATQWIYPVIPKFGAIHPRPDAAVQPDPGADYKVFVDVVGSHADHAKLLPALDRLARIVNMMRYAGVPAEHLHIVALLDEGAAMAGWSNATYRRKFHIDNPNLELVHALRKAGVQLLVCSQALAGQGLVDSAVDPDVTVSLSGVTDPVIYGQRGYSYMRL